MGDDTIMMTYFEPDRARRALVACLIGATTVGLGCRGGTSESPSSTDDTQSVSSTTQRSVSSKTSTASNQPTSTSTLPRTSILEERTSDVSFDNALPNSFDATESGYRATLPLLGDVRLERDGRLTIHPTPAARGDGAVREPAWHYRTQLTSIGRSDRKRAYGTPHDTSLDDSRVVYQYDQLGAEVEYRRRSGQLEQLVHLEQRPTGESRLEVAFSLPANVDARVKQKGDVVHVEDDGGDRLLTWHKLIVRDDHGDRLPARMRVEDDRLVYAIDDAEAQYPLVVDPLATTNWTNVSSENEESSTYGSDVTIRGDFDGNGYEDLLVGQSSYGAQQSNPPKRRGRVLLYLADANGLSNDADWARQGDQTDEQLGVTTVALDDLNGDGADEFVVGGWAYDSNPSNGDDEQNGRVLLYTGSTNLAKTKTTTQNNQALGGSSSWSFDGAAGSSRLGFTMAAAGDVNCDGIPDLAVGAPGWNNARGRARVFHGSSSPPYFNQNQADWLREGQSTNTQGQTVQFPFLSGGIRGAGNVDGDTNQGNDCDDLLVGAPFRKLQSQSGNFYGRAYLFQGSPSGLSQSPSWKKDGNEGSRFGIRVAGLGDIDNDGNDDVALSGYSWNVGGNSKGKVFVYHGSSQSSTGLEPQPALTPTGGSQGARFGIGLDGGNLNDDAYADLIVGADEWFDPNTPNSQPRGRVRVFFGTANGLEEAWTGDKQQRKSKFGNAVATGGDLDDDGNEDLVVAAPSYDTNTSSVGQVFYYRGRSTCYINQTFYRDGESNPSNPCQVCDASNSQTSWSTDPAKAGQSCNPGSKCVVNATCTNGQCTGQPKSCDDNNPCTADSCDPQQGCINNAQPLNGQSCTDDGLACTNDVCRSGTCEHEVASGQCAIDGTCYSKGDKETGRSCSQCRPSLSQTQWSPAPQGADCDDGDFCFVNEKCNGNQIGDVACERGRARNCDSEVRGCAQRGRCLEGSDQCVPVNQKPDNTNCSIDNPCIVDETCQSGFCTGDRVDCSSKDGACQVGQCVVQNGQATCVAKDKPDGVTCDDGNACTVTSCQSGTCSLDQRISCDDNNPCTNDSCDPSQGCVNQNKPNGTECQSARCNQNGNYVPAATCSSGMCQAATVQDCGAYECQLPAGCPDQCSDQSDCKQGNFCLDLPNDSDGDKECYDNRPPTADAGSDQQGIVRNQLVSLDGGQSDDPDDDSLSYQWEFADATCSGNQNADVQRLRQAIEGSSNWTPQQAQTGFEAPAPDCANETLTFELVVDDGEFESSVAETTVEYGSCEETPVAVIDGQPNEANWGETITLDAGSSQPGCGAEIEEYAWSYTPQQPALQTTKSGGQLEVSFPDVCVEEDTDYTFDLTVFDGFQNSSPKSHVVTALGEGTCGGDELDRAEPEPELDAGTDAGEPDTGPNADTGTESSDAVSSDLGPRSDLRAPTPRRASQQDGELGGSGCSTSSSSRPPLSGALLLLLVAGGCLHERRRRD
jgi:hypothetical protein